MLSGMPLVQPKRAVPLSPSSTLALSSAAVPALTAPPLHPACPLPRLPPMLQSSCGLPDVLVNFPAAFRRRYRGRGHEASDLRRLLEMYKRWQV